jgi:hypothetical protein
MSVRDASGPPNLEETMRTVAGLFVGGVVAVVALKLLFGLVLPVVGFFVGLIFLVIKLAIVVGIGYFVYTLVRGRKREIEV